MGWIVGIAVIAAFFAVAFLIVKLNDKLMAPSRKAGKAPSSGPATRPTQADLESLRHFFGRTMPDGLKRWTWEGSASGAPVRLPPPNEDLVVQGRLALTEEAMKELGWLAKTPFLPIATLEEADLLVVDLNAPSEGSLPVHAYFHDGGEMVKIFDDVASLSSALASREAK